MSVRVHRMIAGAALLVGVAAAHTAFAGPEEDLQAGIDAFNDGDLIAAMAFYRAAADAGNAEAQVRLGYILDYSEANEEAVELYRAAAQQGDAGGHYGLGQMYAKGEGVEQDLSEAFRHFLLAAESGNQSAIGVVLNAYETGEFGQPIDAERADYWKDQLDMESSTDE